MSAPDANPDSLSVNRGSRVRGSRLASGATLGFLWITAALVAAALVAVWLDCALPIFTFIWLVVPLVALIRHGDARRVGIGRVGLRLLGRTTTVAALAVTALIVAVEPWSGTYGQLVEKALSADPLDTTFGWLVRFDGAGAWAGFILFSGLVTIFAEELFFRGWLLQLLGRHARPSRAIVIQAALFSLLQTLAALQLSPLQASLYVVVYAFAVVGVIGGYAAWRTASIWPSLAIATTLNALLTYLAT
jgi:membrane protease YdiL (CAAX protease family)